MSIESSDELEQQKLVRNVPFPKRNAPTNARAKDVETEDNLVVRSRKIRDLFSQDHRRNLTRP